jgi:electron transfer flavoprotein beta subunit
MKIAVLIKRVPDTASVLKIGGDNKSVDTGGLKYIISPYDENAMEEALLLKEAGKADEVIAVTMGQEGAQETIRTALAMGADRAVFVKDDAVAGAGQLGTAKVLAAALKTESPDLVFAGKQAVDDDASQVPERIAELMELPHASIVSNIEFADGKLSGNRQIEGGNYSIELPAPALITIEKARNVPRYPTLPNIMKAKKKEIKELSLADVGLSAGDIASSVEVEELALPRQDRLNKILEGENLERVQQLFAALREEEKVF